MIKRYSDQAANERTFLAWIRTAIAVAAFGFLVEKFDLFLDVAVRSTRGRQPSMIGQVLADVTGLLIIALAGAMMVLATIRFRRTAAAMDSADERQTSDVGMNAALVGLLMLFGTVLFAYMNCSVVQHL